MKNSQAIKLRRKKSEREKNEKKKKNGDADQLQKN